MLRTSDKAVLLSQPVSVVLPRQFKAPTFEALGASASGVASGLTSVTPNASANTKGTSFTELGTSTIDGDGFYLYMSGGSSAVDYLLDIGIGAASSETVLIANVLHSSPVSTTYPDVLAVYIPIPIAAGTRVSARCQASGASAAFCSTGVVLARGREYAAVRKRRATTYGAATGDSGGVSIDPGGSINTDGAWVQVDAAITNPIESALILIGNQANAARTDASYRCELGFGANPNEVLVVPTLFMRGNAGHDSMRPGGFERSFFIPGGSRLVARGRSSITDATDRLFDVVVIGFD